MKLLRQLTGIFSSRKQQPDQLAFNAEIPESPSGEIEMLSFGKRSSEEIRQSELVLKAKAEAAVIDLERLKRQNEMEKIDHDRKYGWFFGYKCKRFIKVGGSCAAFGVAVGVILANLPWGDILLAMKG